MSQGSASHPSTQVGTGASRSSGVIWPTSTSFDVRPEVADGWVTIIDQTAVHLLRRPHWGQQRGRKTRRGRASVSL